MGRRFIKQITLEGKEATPEWKKRNKGAIVFDSMFEYLFYQKLKALGLKFEFHPAQRELVPSFKTPALSRGKEDKLILSTVRPIRYTPDFLIFTDDGTKIFIETKGFFEDGARLRYKLFQRSLAKNELTFIVYSMKEGNKFLNMLVENFVQIKKFTNINKI